MKTITEKSLHWTAEDSAIIDGQNFTSIDAVSMDERSFLNTSEMIRRSKSRFSGKTIAAQVSAEIHSCYNNYAGIY